MCTTLLMVLFIETAALTSLADAQLRLSGDLNNNRPPVAAAIPFGLCPSWKPFQCAYDECIPLQYLCDGSRDCTNGYDEDIKMCTAARRPPAIETAALLMQLNAVHGEDFLTNVFGEKARGNFASYGGILKIAIALSESPTYRQFAKSIRMPATDVIYFVRTLEALSESNFDDVKELGFSSSEIPVMKFYTDNLRRTGFF